MSEDSVLAKVKSCTALSDSILQLILEPQTYVPYQAGQYLQIVLPEEALSYSIANAPTGSQIYELHIRHSTNNSATTELFAKVRNEGSLTIRLPFGDCTVDQLDAQRPILFIAAGTGFAPVNAMIEQLITSKDSRDFELFWAARTAKDFYLEETVNLWKSNHKQFQFCSLLAEENKKLLTAQILDRHAVDIQKWQLVISGPFDMVYKTRDHLVAHGVDPSQLYSDAFSFEGQ